MKTDLAMMVRLLLIGALVLCAPVFGAFDSQEFANDVRVLSDVQSRAIGSAGYQKARDYLRSQIQNLPGVELKEHSFDLMVPQTRKGSLTVGGKSYAVHPFTPASIRLNATDADGIGGKLVYCGNGNYSEIKPALLEGNIAVIEASAREDWKTVSYFGARAIIVLPGKDVSHHALRSHEVLIPVNIPRFYLPDEKLAETLRTGTDAPMATLAVQSDWVRQTATNLYAYVAPKDPLPLSDEPGKNSKAWASLTIVTSYDAQGLVPDYSQAASQAVQPAAAMEMLRDFSRNPPRRPVLVAFVGADSFNMKGTRQMMMAFADAPQKWREILTEEIEPKISETASLIAEAQSLQGDPTRLDVVKNRALVERIVKLVETDIALEQDELFRLRVLPEDHVDQAKKDRMAVLESRQLRLGQLKFRFTTKPGELTGDFSSDARSFLDRVLVRLGAVPDREGLKQEWEKRRESLQTRIDLYEWLARRLNEASPDAKIKRSTDPNPRYNNDRLIELLVGLDISDGGRRVGPMYWGRLTASTAISLVQEHREWYEKQAGLYKSKNEQSKWFESIAGVIDFEPMKLVRAPMAYLMTPLPLATEMGLPWGVPAFSMITLEDVRSRRDTPADRFEALDMSELGRQATAVHVMFRAAWDDPTFIGQPEYRRNTSSFEGQVVSTASGKPIPDLPREGFLATYTYVMSVRKIPQVRNVAYSIGVRRFEVADCDSEGRYYWEGIPRLSDLRLMISKVYRTEPGTGEISARTDLGKQAGEIKQIVNIDQDVTPVKSVVFNCQEFTIGGLYDPRFLQGLGEVQLMDARRNAEPQRFDAMLWGQMISGALEPGSRAYLLFRYGRIGNRIVLLNMPEDTQATQKKGVRGEGHGYQVEELSHLGPLAMVTARDFWFLNDSRIEQYRKAGVTSELIDTMHANAWEQLKRAKEFKAANDANGMMKNATGAWADEARVYDAVQKMANDVIYAAIFLLLLAVPFSFCMERLLVGASNIYKQIGYAALVFVLMAAALWMFHPAFKISKSPLIIILAFAIILMSMVVISVVYSRFDTELKRIRSGRGSAEGASFARASVLMSAVMLGIANMRRRKFRTALTSITVVLITFAVLCFTSASRYQGTISLPTGIDAEYPGLLLRQRGFRPMPFEAIDSLQAAYPGHKFVQRWWTLDAGDTKNQLHITVGDGNGRPTKALALQAMLGLSPGESELSAISSAVTNYERLEKGETNIIYLSQATLDLLKAKVGDQVQLGGIPLEIAGVYDATDFDQRVLTLSGSPIAPLKYSTGALDASGRRLTETSVDSLDLDASSSAAEADATYEHLSSSEFAVIPAAISQKLEYGSLRSIGVRLASNADKPADRDHQVETVVDDITKRFAMATFAGYSDGVKLVSASNLSSIGGGANVAIPLAIGGLIIFNTMMGSIAERRREIHIYTSLGLAPVHVGALFVAEALTYGLIGSVFGYIIGQGVGTAMLKLGWLGNVTLNYSGSSAMLTLGLILLIVLLSALVPARLASRIAAPSIERSWRVPTPQGDQIVASLPFTINQTAAEGVIGYLAEFFQAHQEGSIGKFSAGNVEAFVGTSDEGKPTRGLKTIIWLTPFDLGVRQHLLLLIHPGEFDEIYEVQVVLQRLSGDDGSWWRMNRSFLTELRKQFLQWRSLSPQRMKDYVEQSRAMFAQVPAEVVSTDTSEEVRLA